MKNRKKIYLVYFLALTAFLVMTGCKKDVTSSGIPPTISNLRISPQTVTVGQNGGTVAVSLLVDFKDPDGDLFSIVLIAGDGTFSEIPFSSESSDTEGTVGATIDLSSAVAGTFDLVVGVSDQNNNLSESLSGTFTVS